MRVRTGKVIKAISLLGQCNTSTTILFKTGGYTYYPTLSGTFEYTGSEDPTSSHYNNAKKVPVVANHKYYFYVNYNYTSTTDCYYQMKNTNQSMNVVDYSSNGTIFSPTYTDSQNLFTLRARINDEKTLQYAIAIDLTTVFGSGNEPTAEQFYNKYKNKLELLATGEEIVLDRGSGNVNLYPRLPSEYQEVEYIQGTGTQYINTNFIPDNTCGMVFKASSADNADTVMVGVRTSGNRWWVGSNGNSIYAGWNNNDASGSRALFTVDVPYTYQLNYMNNRKRICDGIEGQVIGNEVLGTQSFPAYILAGNADGSSSGLIKKGIIYYVVFTKGTTIVRHYIPCYRKSDNVIGMYDLVNEVFYTNAGTGTFSKGVDINLIQSYNPTVKMYGYNQHSPLWSSGSYNGVTVTATNGGRGISLSDTATGWFTYDNLFDVTIPSGHKVLVDTNVVNNTGANFGYRLRYNSQTAVYSGNNFSQIITLSGDINKLQLYGDLGDDFTGITLDDCIVIDLTDWYGPGKEPTTVAEFKEKFPNDYYGYCPNKIMLTKNMINALPIYGYNQQCDSNDGTKWYVNSNATKSFNDGVVTFTGTAISGRVYQTTTRIIGHKYLASSMIKLSSSSQANNSKIKMYAQAGTGIGVSVIATSTVDWQTLSVIFEGATNISGASYPTIQDDNTSGWLPIQVKNMMFIDLTDWYGAGSEPSTVAEFKATFPYKYYQYCKKSLLNKYQINALGSN